jgi:uncharacterized protein (TIGR03435 family)
MAPAISGDPRQINFSGVTLCGLVIRAYDLRPNQLVGPEWLKSKWYSLVAKVPNGAPPGQIPAMLQNLLAERFKMRVHWKTEEVQGYALVVGKNGPKITKSVLADGSPSQEASFSMRTSSNGRFKWQASTLDMFAESLTTFMSSPVVDMTQIQGVFDIAFNAAPDSMPGMPMPGTPPRRAVDSYPTIFVAIENLGLKLEAIKVAVKELVVESALKIPTEN